MNRIITLLRKYLTKYLSTRMVFLVDMIMSFAASCCTIMLIKLISNDDILFTDQSAVWLVSSFVFSFAFIWGLKTYRIIIRHSTIKELGSFILVALFKQLMSGFVFGLLYGFELDLLMLTVVDFFLTFSFFFIVRVFMTLLYDAIKGQLDQRNQCQNVLIYGITEKSVSIISRLASSQQLGAGHGGGDFFIVSDFIHAIRTGERPAVDVYDACEWTAVGLLSELSVTNNGRTMAVPRFRKGATLAEKIIKL